MRSELRAKRVRTNIIFLAVIAFLIFLCVSGYFMYRGQKPEIPSFEDKDSQIANPEDFDFELFEGETRESAIQRSNSIGTGYVFISDNGEVSVEPADKVYVLNWVEIQEGYPKVWEPEVMYNWDKNLGAERMVCVASDELTTESNVGYYCEAESLTD